MSSEIASNDRLEKDVRLARLRSPVFAFQPLVVRFIDSELRVSLNLPYGSRRDNAVKIGPHIEAAFADINIAKS